MNAIILILVIGGVLLLPESPGWATCLLFIAAALMS